MGVGTLISLEEYLSTSYSPDREYRDGIVVERNVGDRAHAWLQASLAWYFRSRMKQWKITVFTELRIRAREGWFPIPDVCVYLKPAPDERVPSRMPLLWIEILSKDDKITEVWEKARELVECGCLYVWIIDPNTLESELRTATGVSLVQDKTLRLPDSPIVVPLLEVVDE